jgi:hypothetical protein
MNFYLDASAFKQLNKGNWVQRAEWVPQFENHILNNPPTQTAAGQNSGNFRSACTGTLVPALRLEIGWNQ